MNGELTEAEHITFALIEDYTHIALACAVEPLRLANHISGRELYRWTLISENGKTARSSNGITTLVDGGLDPVPARQNLFVLSGTNVARHVSPALLSFIRRERACGTRIGGLCSGAYVLAKAGLLDGVPTAIHWDFHDSFAETFPNIPLRRNVFVAEQKYITASGGTATADLMLHLIGKAHGEDLSIAIADQLVYNAVREETAEQRVSIQSRCGTRNRHLAAAIKMMTDSIEHPVSPCDIAARLGISTRQLERIFERHVGCSPKRYFTDMRLAKARNLLVQTEASIVDIALACGFSSSSHFSRVYRAHNGITPVLQRTRIA
ncbi:GlxA family transcriptional regulator [Oricola sp.]|uniref:GlxA family transcriptional regulator n=1 Tax=Oricola sp. TaxID=1979950 RepID=UPI003BA8EFE2